MELQPVQNTYKGGFFKNRHRLSWRAPIVGEALIATFDLKTQPFDGKSASVVDVGCAIGDYVHWLNENGFNAWGIEGSSAAEEFMVTSQYSIWDLRQPIPVGQYERKFDIAFSLEVAEHIETQYAGIYIDNLCALSDTILISAASPGQKGHGHVNCAPRGYWIDRFRERGFVNMKGLENRWKSVLSPFRSKKELSSYIKNAICFGRVK